MRRTTSRRWFLCFVWCNFNSKSNWLRHFPLSPEEKPKNGESYIQSSGRNFSSLVTVLRWPPSLLKISATVHDIRHNKQTVSEGLSAHLSLSTLFLFILLDSSLLQSDYGHQHCNFEVWYIVTLFWCRIFINCSSSSEFNGLVPRWVWFWSARRWIAAARSILLPMVL